MNENEKHTLLVIDDDKANIISLTHILSPEYDIYDAKSGREGIKLAAKFKPDLILLDILMPKMDGFETLAELRASSKTRDIPVIFITGLDDKSAEDKGLDLGASDYITKPFSPESVKLRLRNRLELREDMVKKNRQREEWKPNDGGDEENKQRILIVEDDKTSIITLTQILSTNYHLYIAKNGLDAIRIAEQYDPDLILLDINMPEIDGFEVFSLLKNSDNAKNIPVVFVTGLSDAETENRALMHGASDYITKPFSAVAINLRIRNQIGMKRVHAVRGYERRVGYRLRCSLPIQIYRQKENGGLGYEIAGEIVNVSDNGMYFAAAEMFERGERVVLTFEMDGKVIAPSLVLRVDDKASGGFICRAVVQFAFENERARDQVYKYILKEQMEKRALKK